MIWAFVAFFAPIEAITDRDIGPMPNLNLAEVNRWIVFFTNIERVKSGRIPLAYDSKLEKAADWIANYCAKTLQDISHNVSESGMASFSDRVRHFGGTMRSGGENLTIAFRANTENVTYFRREDEKGPYIDYGDHNVHWRNDREMAWAMVDAWMHSSGHYANIMGNFASIGAGSAAGVYTTIESGYGAQVFSSYATTDFSQFAWHNELRNFSYEGKLRPICFAVSGSNQPRVIPTIKEGKALRCELRQDEPNEVFAGLYDASTRTTYPVIQIK